MKTVETFFQDMAFGQLKQTPATDDDRVGLIYPEVEEQLLQLTNQGLVDITTRLKLFEGTDIVTFVDAQNIYDFNVMSGFDNFVKPLSVHGKDVYGNEKVFIPKTNSHITLPSPYTIRFSTQFMEDYVPSVDVHYQKTHAPVDMNATMELPNHLYEALALYVSGLYISHMGGQENTAKGDSYYGLYLSMLQTDVTENKSGTSEVVDEDTRFADRGFV